MSDPDVINRVMWITGIFVCGAFVGAIVIRC
jgi:hypothetical protein